MGGCICKSKNENILNDEPTHRDSREAFMRGHGNGSLEDYEKSLSETVDRLVNETLDVIGCIKDSEPDPPNSILMLHMITDKPSGWIELVQSLIRVIPADHPMGPSVIALLLDDSPLPSKESVLKVSNIITNSLCKNPQKERNLCVVLGCLAEKLAGPSSIGLLNELTLMYLINNIREEIDLNVKLLSIIAIEKFAQTRENKATIKKALDALDVNPLFELEKFATDDNYLLRQIGFCARWCLDNYFLIEGRKFSYETADVSNTNAMLNSKDVSDNLKISPEGLEARCDAYTFESVRCTFKISEGCWYYEVYLITPGVMQIGWATKDSNFLSDDGYGIGDDKYSIGFDGCRKLIWHNAKSIPHNLSMWKSGSVLGCLLDFERNEVIFSLDGYLSQPHKNIFENVNQGFFAAASFMSFQQCKFNFGKEPFCFPPQRPFQIFNNCGVLSPKAKIILPRHIYLELLRKVSVQEDSCTLCFDRKACMRLDPCRHRGFCDICIGQLKFCPMCRADITNKIYENTESRDNNIRFELEQSSGT